MILLITCCILSLSVEIKFDIIIYQAVLVSLCDEKKKEIGGFPLKERELEFWRKYDYAEFCTARKHVCWLKRKLHHPVMQLPFTKTSPKNHPPALQ